MGRRRRVRQKDVINTQASKEGTAHANNVTGPRLTIVTGTPIVSIPQPIASSDNDQSESVATACCCIDVDPPHHHYLCRR